MEDEADVYIKDPTIICIVESQKKLFAKSMIQDSSINKATSVNNPILILIRLMSFA